MSKKFAYNEIPMKLDIFDNETYMETQEEFYAVVTNIETGKAEYKKIDNTHDKVQLEYLRASGSMPYVSRIVKVEGQKYLDGGLADSIPVEKMMEMGVDKIIVVLTRTIDYRKKQGKGRMAKIKYRKYPNFIDTLNNRYLMYNNQVEKIIELEKENKIFVIRPTRKVQVARVERDEERLQEMYDLGVQDCKNKLEELKKYLEN